MNSSIFGFGHIHYCKWACQSKIKKKNRMENSVHPDETAYYKPSHLDLHCLQSYLLWFTGVKGLNQLLTLKAPRKTASENVVCLCHLLNILADFSNLFFAYRQTVWTLIRLLLKEQSDLGPHCLQKWPLNSQADDKADDNSCDWRFKG